VSSVLVLVVALEQMPQAELELAAEQPDQAVELVVGVGEGQRRASVLEHRRAGLLEPQVHGAAMHVVQLCERIDRDLVKVALAQQVALPQLDGRERSRERVAQLRRQAAAQVLELGIVIVAEALEQHLVIARWRGAAPGQVDDQARGHDSHPRAQRSAPAERRDPGGLLTLAHEQVHVHELAKLVAREPERGAAGDRAIELDRVQLDEAAQRLAIPATASDREVEIGVGEALEVIGLGQRVSEALEPQHDVDLELERDASSIESRRQQGLQIGTIDERTDQRGRECSEEALAQGDVHALA
jgi:hypothetical protein